MRIFLAGQFGVEAGGVVVDGTTLGPLGGLALAFLVSERHRPVPRDELAEVLWGEDLPPTWEPSLRALLSRVRRRLGAAGLAGEVIAGGGGCYQAHLPAGVVVDVEQAAVDLEAATEALRQGGWTDARRLAAACADVAGHGFLPGLGGLWVERRQAELDELRVRALEAFADAATAAGDHAGAVGAAEAAVAAQPLRESAHLRVMAAHAGAGNPAEALRAYERCRVVLADELGTSPSERTQAAYLALLAGETGPPESNLRPELSSFVGRDEARRDVRKLLSGNRLVTLVGPGGVGKTRLAIRVSSEVVGRYRDGVRLVELAALADPSLLPQHVLSALDQPATGATALDSLRDHLSARDVLLVLDNCEHLSDACAALVRTLLETCARLVVLATSRRPLGVPGESRWRVPPLSLPAPGDGGPWDSEAVRLFVERASAVDPDFTLTPDRAAAVADICHRLDGLPLAIELAAAWTPSLSVTEIADRLGDRFRLLVGRDPTAPDRHHSLRAAVEWSYEGLSPAEQRLFRRTCVYAGGLTLEAAEAVAPEDPDVLGRLAALVDKSLVLADRTGPTTRYRLLETLRQYGLARLADAGEDGPVRDRQLAWARSLAEAAEVGLAGPEQDGWLSRLDAEEDNLRAALEWAAGKPGSDDGLRTAGALGRYWQVRARFSEGGRWLRALLESATGVSPPVRAKALTAAGALLVSQSSAPLHPADLDTARSWFEESIAIGRRTGDARAVGLALHGLGGMYYRQRDLGAARACFEQALADGRALNDRHLAAASLAGLGNLALRSFDMHVPAPAGLDAASLYEESLALWKGLGDQLEAAAVLGQLAALAMRAGRFETASALAGEGVDVQRRLGDHRGLALSIRRLADVARSRAEPEAARRCWEEILDLARAHRDPLLEAGALLELGEAWWEEGDYARARLMYERAAAIGRTVPVGWALYLALNGLAALALTGDDVSAARHLLEEAAAVAREAHEVEAEDPWSFAMRAVAASAEGDGDGARALCGKVISAFSATPSRPPLALVTALDVLAVLDARAGAFERSAQLVGAADGLRIRHEDPFAPFRSRPEQQQARRAAKNALGDAGFASAHAAGAGLSTGEVIALAASALRSGCR